jgi:hypothetical protein
VGCRGRPARAARRSHAARPGGEPWRRRTFLSGQAVSPLGDGLAALAIPLLVLDLSRSPLISALSAASVTVGYLMVGLPAGCWSTGWTRGGSWCCRVTSGVRVLFLAVDPVGVVLAGTATSALGGDPRPVFLAAGTVTAVAAAAGWLAGLRRAGHGGGGARR